ncbi:MAG: amino acid ABC transporter ATP-binding protein [Methylobacteriaceae bacterium]|nr:amino acid ABC transporter ATP-binding protein [Methylobacteriaceae bacterium]MBV9245129.1 amino acid ABC transporter ATP-binding protein [Methylobacteriaceae bacterium]
MVSGSRQIPAAPGPASSVADAGGAGSTGQSAEGEDRLPATQPFVEIRNLRKSYARGAIPVLKGVGDTMSKTDRLVILGPSGGGKSTLLRCVMGLETIDSGAITLDGRNYIECLSNGRTFVDRTVQRQVGMVFQHYTLFPHLTVLGNLILAPVKRNGEKKGAAIARAEALLSRFGLISKLKSYPSQLSGGQKQREAIARALMLEPKLMLFDEVTSALDPELIAEVESMISELAEGGMPMMIVTHDMGFAKNIATKVLFCADGVVMESGDPETFFAAPKIKRTRDFLASILRGTKV